MIALVLILALLSIASAENVYSPVMYPGPTSTVALGINDGGTIVGCYVNGSGSDKGFIATPHRCPDSRHDLLICPGLAGLIVVGRRFNE
jgi:hypothetical protein